MALAEPAQFTTEKKKWKYYPIVFVKCPDLLKYWATHTFSALDGITYEPIIKNISAVSCKIDRDGGLATVGNLTIDLSNMEDYADWLASTPNVENNVCEFYLIFNDGTALVFNEAIKFFTGLIEETEIDYDTLSISVSHQDLFLNNYVGGLIAEDVYDLQYPSSVGKFKPIIYGNHTYQGTKPTADFNPDEVPKVVPCIQLSENQYMVAGHELGYFTYTNLWLYNRNLKRFFYVDPDVNEIDISNPDGDGNCTFTVSRNRALTVWDCWFPSGIVQSTYGTAGEFSDEDNIIDKSNSTYGRLNDTFNAGDVTNVQLSFMPYDFSGFTSIMDVQFYSRRDWTAGGTAYWKVKELGYAERKAFVIDAVYDSGPPPFVTITTGQYVNGVVTEAAHGFLVGETVQIGDVFEGYTSLGYVNRVILTVADSTHFTIYHPTDQTWTAGKLTSCKVGSSDEFSIASTTYGYPVYTGDAWLKTKDSLKSSVAVTVNGTGSIDAKLYLFFKRIKMGVHPSSDNILCASCQGVQSGGNYVVNPVSIIKHLATTYGGMADGDFDSTAFTAAESARSSWVFNPVFLEYRKTKEWIHDLAKACSVFAFWNNGNDLKIVPYTQGASAAYTANVLTISEVAASSSGVFSESPAKKGSLSLGRTPIDEIANKINVQYSYNYVTGKIYKRIVTENSTSQGVYGEYEKMFELPFTTDDTTAGYYAANLLDALAWRLWTVKNITARLSSFNIELGDVADVDNFIDDSIKWLVTAVAHNATSGQGWINLGCIEQRDTSGDSTSSIVEAYIGEDVVRYNATGEYSGYVGGSGATGESGIFYGKDNPELRGFVYFDQFGQPIYRWLESDGTRLIRKESFTQP